MSGQAPPPVVSHYVRRHIGPVDTFSARRAANGDWYLTIRPIYGRSVFILKVCLRHNRPSGFANISYGEPDCDFRAARTRPTVA